MLRTVARCVSCATTGTSSRLAPLSFRACAATLAPIAALSNKPKLRDYQQECIKSVLLSLKRGHKRVGISLATGSGKTVSLRRVHGGDASG